MIIWKHMYQIEEKKVSKCKENFLKIKSHVLNI